MSHSVRYLAGALIALSFGAGAFEPAVDRHKSKPVVSLVTEHHGAITFDYSKGGKVFSRVTDIPYAGPRTCKGWPWQDKVCQSLTLSVQDGVEVLHNVEGLCEVVENSVLDIGLVNTDGFVEMKPVVSSIRYEIECLSRAG